MAVERIETHKYMCDSLDCGVFEISKSGRPQGWGVVRVYDNKWSRDEIGDQNGWNNYDLCPGHYSAFMSLLDIQAHNIPEVPDDVG